VDADIAAIQAAMSSAMDGEDRRREVAAASPGFGTLVPLGQPPSGAGVGISDVDLPIVGEGYSVTAPDAVQHKAYGPARPVYADDVLAGPAIRVFLGSRSAPADGVVFVSPPGRPSLVRRLLARVRGR
jgi:hypothetical protein